MKILLLFTTEEGKMAASTYNCLMFGISYGSKSRSNSKLLFSHSIGNQFHVFTSRWNVAMTEAKQFI